MRIHPASFRTELCSSSLIRQVFSALLTNRLHMVFSYWNTKTVDSITDSNDSIRLSKTFLKSLPISAARLCLLQFLVSECPRCHYPHLAFRRTKNLYYPSKRHPFYSPHHSPSFFLILPIIELDAKNVAHCETHRL